MHKDVENLERLTEERVREQIRHEKKMADLDAEIAKVRARITAPSKPAPDDGDEEEGVLWWTRLLQPDPLAPVPPGVVREVAKAIAELGGEAKLGQIVEHLGIDQGAVSERLTRAVNMDIVERVGVGLYRLTKTLPESKPRRSRSK